MFKLRSQNIGQNAEEYRIKRLEHVLRAEEDRIPRKMLQYRPKKGRSIGRPKKRSDWSRNGLVPLLGEEEFLTT
jgi:hypothetical protein